jgi:RNA polymerase sigma-70 factor (sigma-E family)
MRSDEDFAAYVRANGGHLLKVAYLQTGNAATAQDIVQSVLGRAMLSWQRIAAGNPDAYLRRAILNERTTLWRRIGRRELLGGEPKDAGVADGSAVTDTRLVLVAALRQLPSRQRAAVVLRYLEDLPDAEIAVILDCTPATVRSHIFRGLARLRPLLGEEPSNCDPERIDS